MISKKRLGFVFLAATLAAVINPVTQAQEEDDIGPQPAWVDLSADERKDVLAFAEDYKSFMTRAKTELSFVKEAVKIASRAGFKELTDSSNLRPGARFYDINRDRTITLIVIGSGDFVCNLVVTRKVII